MAESYVTKFTKYVSKQRDALEGKLKSKGFTLSPQASLGSLVSELDNLQETFKPMTYERDENFPDFDEMFDNDPLRAVNGGQYKACLYWVVALNAENVCNCWFGSSNAYITGKKVIFSDGTEYDNLTSSNFTHTVNENGIYVDKYGFKFCLVKVYNTEPYTSSSTIYSYKNIKEWIDDYFIGFQYQGSAASGGPAGSNFASLEYFRYVGSNVTVENAPSSSYWKVPTVTTVSTMCSNPSSSAYGAMIKHIRIDGLHRFDNFLSQINLEVLDVRGAYIPSSTTATTTSFTLGQTSYSAITNSHMRYVKTPFCEIDTTISLHANCKEVFITDNVVKFDIVYNSGTPQYCYAVCLEKLHIGNGLTTGISASQSYRPFYNLRHVTCSLNAFSKNESAITVDFGNAPNLTKQSILNMFNNFADRTDKTANILKLAKYSEQYLTDEEKAILTNKNWTLTFV